MNKLKLLPYYHEDYDKIEKEAVNTNNFTYNNWWYLHGELENILHYDKASVINAKECPELVKMIPYVSELRFGVKDEFWKGTVDKINLVPHLYINDIIECEVIGIEEECIGYFWTTEELPLKIFSKTGEIFTGTLWKQRGLVCFKSDAEGCKYALRKYKEKAVML